MEYKILGNYHNICLFCGNEMEQKWEEYESYYECDCEDAKLCREIDEKIANLKRQKPLRKYRIEKKELLYKLEDLY